MDLFHRLAHEHRTILEVLEAFERYLAAADPDPTELPRFLFFLREFADTEHHALEEMVLMPALARHGFAMDASPSVFIRQQHESERDMLFELVHLGLRMGPGAALDAQLRASAASYVAFQRAHIARETELLFPVAKKQLAMDTAMLEEALVHFDSGHKARGRSVWLERLVGELLVTHRAPVDEAAPGPG